TQALFTQALPKSHVLPQAPQLLLSMLLSTHVPLHTESGAGQLSAQPLERHTCDAVHALPQPPQFFGSICVLTQVPPHDCSPAPGHEPPGPVPVPVPLPVPLASPSPPPSAGEPWWLPPHDAMASETKANKTTAPRDQILGR